MIDFLGVDGVCVCVGGGLPVNVCSLWVILLQFNVQFRELERNRLRVIEGLVFNGLDNLVTLKLKRNAIAELMDGAFWRLSRIQLL